MTAQLTSGQLIQVLNAVADKVIASKDYLCELDGAIGDGDHGIGMARAFQSIKDKLQGIDPQTAEPSDVLKTAGMTIISEIGGAMGPLFGGAFLRAGTAVAGKKGLDINDALTILQAAEAAVRERGKVEVGDKTMLDTLYPAKEALAEALAAGFDPAAAGEQSIAAAKKGMEATKDMLSRRGRSSRLGERTLGHQDAGATSVYLILEAAYQEIKKICGA